MSEYTSCIIGIDPGLAATGYGLIRFEQNKFKHITHGVIQTNTKMAQGMRLLIIYEKLSAILKKYKPCEAGIETLYFAKNVTSALKVSEARGVVLMALEKHTIPVSEYAPNTIKKAITGMATADKLQVQEAVRFLLGLSEIPKPNHAADALAAAITKINLNDVQEFSAYV